MLEKNKRLMTTRKRSRYRHKRGYCCEERSRTEEQRRKQMQVVTQSNQEVRDSVDLLNLLCEFARGCEDEGLRLVARRVDRLEDANRERGRLARAALRLRDHVAPRGDGHDRALLDRGRLLKPCQNKKPDEEYASKRLARLQQQKTCPKDSPGMRK